MAALNFPASPTVNDTFSNGTQTWYWNGTMWKTSGQVAPTGPAGATGSAGNDLPKITAVTYTDSSYTSNGSTSVLSTGGYVKLTGSNFQSGCTVTAGSVAATATYVSSTQVNVALAANSIGTYHLYLVNPDGGSTLRVNGAVYALPATGGTITTSGLYTYHTFNSTGTFTPSTNLSVDYIAVAGGGSGGGYYYAGGGGGGGVVINTGVSVTANTVYTVTIGGGSAAGTTGNNGNTGNDTTITGSGFTTVTAKGGGYGGLGYSTLSTGGAGGSGGGGGAAAGGPSSGAAGGSSNQTNAGGTGYGNSGAKGGGTGGGTRPNYAGGGGGAGGVPPSYLVSGQAALQGNGGDGYQWVNGTYYGGGGAGGADLNFAATSATVGGLGNTSANGGYNSQNAGNGATNAGGGGGGAAHASYGPNAGNGGSGIVIIRYLT